MAAHEGSSPSGRTVMYIGIRTALASAALRRARWDALALAAAAVIITVLAAGHARERGDDDRGLDRSERPDRRDDEP